MALTRTQAGLPPADTANSADVIAEARKRIEAARKSMADEAASRITQTTKASLENRFVLVNPRCSIPSNSRTSKRVAERSAQAGGPAASVTRASVKTFDDAVLVELRDLRAEMIDYLSDIGFKAPGGMYIIHSTYTLDIAQKGQDFQKRYKVAADAFLNRYEQACKDWRDNLGEDADETKYADVDKLRTRLGLGANAERYGFRLDVTPIGEFAEKFKLDASQGELDYLQNTMRSQFDAVVASGLGEMQQALDELAASNEPGKKVRKEKLDRVAKTARKLRDNGLVSGDVERIVTRAEKAAVVPPQHKKDRADYVKNVASVAADLNAILGGFDASEDNNPL